MYYNLPVTISNINTQYLRQLSPSRLSAIVKKYQIAAIVMQKISTIPTNSSKHNTVLFLSNKKVVIVIVILFTEYSYCIRAF